MITSVHSNNADLSVYTPKEQGSTVAEQGGTLDKLKNELDAVSSSEEDLSAREDMELQRLKRRDRGVHQHELMHRIYAGEYARGNISFKYEVGPDGKRYAVHGEVSIDASPVPGNPEKTIEKMDAIRRAASAPRDPSSADRRAAMMAQRAESAARAELRQKEADEAREEKRMEEYDEMKEPVETDRRLMGPDQVVNLFRSTIRPELVSNLFDLFA